MKLKELHIRNIASIERADIDFDRDLNDAVTGEPASIFLIAGDTGAGKSVVLDCIAMALYKKTPRVAAVANAMRNEYTDASGEQMRVASLEQYTRLSITEKDECYSEVVFEGNDGRTYHARLALGMMRGQKDKDTGLRPIKHRSPKWELRIDDGDWTKDSVETTILDAVGLDFQQFGRMAMLAQGQFANFLTGNKKEREAILEQLTNTQHFTAYGEAVSSLFRKAKLRQERLQTSYDTERPHSLTDDEVGQLEKQLAETREQQEALERQLKAMEATTRLVESVEQNERLRDEAAARRRELEAMAAADEYTINKALYTEWDATSAQRQTLAELLRARRDEDTVRLELESAGSVFATLTADLAYRQKSLRTAEADMARTREWLRQWQRHDALLARAGEAELKLVQYDDKVAKCGLKEKQLEQEQARTPQLAKAAQEAEAAVSDANKAVAAKDAEIDELNRQRADMNPQGIADTLSLKQTTLRATDELRKAHAALLASVKETDALRAEVVAEGALLQTMRATCERDEAAYVARKAEAERTQRCLATMQMSLDEAIVALRHRLRDESAATCPLCGGQIDHAHLADDFDSVLTPLEQEQQRAAQALAEATRRRDASKTSYATHQGALQGKQAQLARADTRNAADKAAVEVAAVRLGLRTDDTLQAQAEAALATLGGDIARLKARQAEAERLQQHINKLHAEKQPLTDAKVRAEKAKARADSDVRANGEATARIIRERDDLVREREALKAELDALFAAYAPAWQADTQATRSRLHAEAAEYVARQRQLQADTARRDTAQTLVVALAGMQADIVRACPQWAVASEGRPYACDDISREWTTLLSRATALTSRIADCRATATRCDEALGAYYAASGGSEKSLQKLMGMEEQVAHARRFVADVDAQLKSRCDAMANAQRQMDEAMKALGIDDRRQLPSRQGLDDEKAAAGRQRDELVALMGQTRTRLATHRANMQRLKAIEAELEDARQQCVRWERLNGIFGGTRFRTLVQTYILRPLLNNANVYLERITDRYRLTCSTDNEQLSILVTDRYNKNQLRSATVLSGGERFMVSLALSLALSSLNRPDMNVNILFIDEGFGTLDEKSLDTVMQTLEKLQEIAGQTNRRVGIISHREELDERIPVKIKVVRKGEGRSTVDVVRS